MAENTLCRDGDCLLSCLVPDCRRIGNLIGRIHTRKSRDQSGSGFDIESLGIPLFTNFERRVQKNLRETFCPDDLSGLFAVLAIRRNKCRYGDQACFI